MYLCFICFHEPWALSLQIFHRLMFNAVCSSLAMGHWGTKSVDRCSLRCVPINHYTHSRAGWEGVKGTGCEASCWWEETFKSSLSSQNSSLSMKNKDLKLYDHPCILVQCFVLEICTHSRDIMYYKQCRVCKKMISLPLRVCMCVVYACLHVYVWGCMHVCVKGYVCMCICVHALITWFWLSF